MAREAEPGVALLNRLGTRLFGWLVQPYRERLPRRDVQPATKDGNHIRRRRRIGNNPKIGHPTQQRRPFQPNSGNQGNKQEDRANPPANEPSARKWGIRGSRDIRHLDDAIK
jgi:hypothetical protein